MSARRLGSGGLVDRGRPIDFLYEGRTLQGYAGDTLASALLANGVSVIGRSFKYHRPRGLLGAGVEEPNALMQMGQGALTEPNVRATEVELEAGLCATPVNCWPSARFDLGGVNNLFGRFLPAGFYYKTFMWPDWHLFEPLIRRAAGLGRAPKSADPDRYESRSAHCDLLIIGAGPAGLAAALAASKVGRRVMLVEQDFAIGGSLLGVTGPVIEGLAAPEWLKRASDSLAKAADTTVLTRTTAVGYFDHNCLTLVERLPQSTGAKNQIRQRFWTVRARHVVLATGALERPLVFPGNDRPGVMLASAVRSYLQRWGILAGARAVIFTNNDTAYMTALACLDAGGGVQALVDSRRSAPPHLVDKLRSRGVRVMLGAQVTDTGGRPTLNRVSVRDAEGRTQQLAADLLAMSGGWNPTVHLFSQSGGKLAWDEGSSAFRPEVSAQAERSVGAAAGGLSLGIALSQGAEAGGGAAPTVTGAAPAWAIEPLWRVASPGKAFVDFQNDVTVADVALSAREAFVSVEHLKRYTTLGMAPDQGKTSNVNGLAILADLTSRTIAQTGTTRFRFPYTPVSFGALAGRARGEMFRPLRRLPTHDRQAKAGAVFEDYGGWLRPACYPAPGEGMLDAEQREVLAVRQGVGLFEGSPLGKIEVVGPHAAEFLDRIYANTFSTLKVGRARYGLMLNELGVVIDDGITLRLAQDRFLVGTTSAGAVRIADWLEEWLQCEWPDLEVLTTPSTTAVAVLIVSGPKARAVLQAAGVDFALAAADFPHMSFRDGVVAGIPARVLRSSFTGEVSFEINVAADRAVELWDVLTTAGGPYGIVPVGIEAWMLLRMEKGFLHVGADTDGTTSPADVGWGHVLNRKHDFVGRRSLTRPDNERKDRPQLVGLEAVGSGDALPVGASLRRPDDLQSEGYVTSTGFSPVLGRGVALGMVKGGSGRHGEELEIASREGQGRRVKVVAPGVYDREGVRLND
jgi:sarcosine oxidase subunit alpha